MLATYTSDTKLSEIKTQQHTILCICPLTVEFHGDIRPAALREVGQIQTPRHRLLAHQHSTVQV